MLKPQGYDTTQAANYGDAQLPAITPGGHGAIIKKAFIADEEYDGIKYQKLVIWFDIQEGSEFDGYYEKKYRAAKQFSNPKYGDPRWQGEFKQSITTKEGYTNPFFKGLITSIEKSNPPYKFDFNENGLKGKKIGLVFGEEDFIGKNDGQLHTTVKARWACDYDSFPSMPVPAKKVPQNKPAAANPFEEQNKAAGLQAADDVDDELPFE